MMTPEQQLELQRFPDELRQLVESEVAAGNAIVEIGCSFPAPPIGAFVKLERMVGTRPRESFGSVVFYERYGSAYSGEFTDEKRYFFVLEPPLPPEAEPTRNVVSHSMPQHIDAIEPSVQQSEDRLPHPSLVSVNSPFLAALAQDYKRRYEAKSIRRNPDELKTTETDELTIWEFEFIEKRTPAQIRLLLESRLSRLFVCRTANHRLVMETSIELEKCSGKFTLTYLAAIRGLHCFRMRIEFDRTTHSPAQYQSFANALGAWLNYWLWGIGNDDGSAGDTGFTVQAPEESEYEPKKPPSETYLKRCEEVLNLEAEFDSIDSIQRLILSAVRGGWRFICSHKEGNSTLHWFGGSFRRSDCGEYRDERIFPDETEFLLALQRFCLGDLIRNLHSDTLQEFDQWRLILREMTPPAES